MRYSRSLTHKGVDGRRGRGFVLGVGVGKSVVEKSATAQLAAKGSSGASHGGESRAQRHRMRGRRGSVRGRRRREPIDMVPENAPSRVLAPDPNGGTQEGIEFKTMVLAPEPGIPR